MKILQKSMLAQVAGGEADEVVFAISGDGGFGADYGGGNGSEYVNEYGYGGYGDGGYGAMSVAVDRGFDANGIGPVSCTPAPPPPPAEGLFGFTLLETFGGVTALTVVGGGIGHGIGASVAIEAAGGMAGVGAMGAGAAGLMSSAALGVMSSAIVGVSIGYLSYQNSETVRTVVDGTGAGIIDGIVDVAKRGIGHFSGSTAGGSYEP